MSLLKPLTTETKERINSDPFYKQCARCKDGNCDGRITMEHSLTYAGIRIGDWWAIVPLCEYHHSVNNHQDGKGLDKNKNIWIALNRASDEDLLKYPRANFIEKRNLLNRQFGEYKNYA